MMEKCLPTFPLLLCCVGDLFGYMLEVFYHSVVMRFVRKYLLHIYIYFLKKLQNRKIAGKQVFYVKTE